MFSKSIFILIIQWCMLETNSSKTPPMVLSPAQINSLKELSEIPLDKLLKVKKSLTSSASINRFDEAPTNIQFNYKHGPEIAHAQPLIGGEKKPLLRREYEHEWTKDSGGGKIRSAFHLAITTLSFLAFGGYLLCMIVQAVKNKGMYYPMQPQTTQAPMFLSFPPKRGPQIASYGRKRRSQNGGPSYSSIHIQSDEFTLKNDTGNLYYEPMFQGGILANQYEMYNALIMLSEGFAKHSVI